MPYQGEHLEHELSVRGSLKPFYHITTSPEWDHKKAEN